MVNNNIQHILLRKADQLLDYLENMHCDDKACFTDEEVQNILRKEETGAQANYERALAKFNAANNDSIPPKSKRFIVYWGYPGAGKSVMTPKLIERFSKEEDCLPFNIIDKDEHRDLFPNLFDHLKNGHIDECERFAGVAIDYVRTILDLSLKNGQRSVLSVGSIGAGSDFCDNAKKAIDYGYRPCAAYMAVHPDIAYLSNVYRSAELYDKIIFKNHELYPRLVSADFFGRAREQLPKMLAKIDAFQKENADNVNLIIVNRANDLLYDSRNPQRQNVLDVLKQEEMRPLTAIEMATINKQLHAIQQNMKYRYETGIYAPCRSEKEVAKTAVSNIANLLKKQPQRTLQFINIFKKTGNDY